MTTTITSFVGYVKRHFHSSGFPLSSNNTLLFNDNYVENHKDTNQENTFIFRIASFPCYLGKPNLINRSLFLFQARCISNLGFGMNILVYTVFIILQTVSNTYIEQIQ